MECIIYTDGSCLSNPGPGGWAYKLLVKTATDEIDFEHQASGASETNMSTNNQMELQAAIEALKFTIELMVSNPKNIPDFPGPVCIITDSTYLKDGITKWVLNWQRNNWRTASGTPVKNQNLWQELINLSQKIDNLTWSWTKAHNGDHYNELVDKLARLSAQGC